MFERIEIFDKRYAELNRRLYEPDVAANPDEYQRVIKEIKSIEEIVLTYRDYKGALQTERDSLEILNDNSDPELKELAQLELEEAKEKLEELSEQLKILLLPKDPNDERNVIVEIRGGAGGEESALFSAVLFRMYSMYAEKRGYKIEIINANETELGGYKAECTACSACPRPRARDACIPPPLRWRCFPRRRTWSWRSIPPI